MLNRDTSPQSVLGVYVTPQTIEAVLMRPAGTYAQVLHRFSRPRLRVGEAVEASDFASVLPGMKSSEDVDFTLQVGNGDGANLSFDDDDLGSSGGTPNLFLAPLREILEECHKHGYADPDVAFCVGSPDVAYVELTQEDDTADVTTSAWDGLKTKLTSLTSGQSAEEQALHAQLRDTYVGAYDARRVLFLPMTPPGMGERYLALVPTGEESVTPTVQAYLSNAADEAMAPRLLESEATLLRFYVQEHLQPADDATTAIVRVGTEDTLLSFMQGGEVRHVERLRSLTSFDPAEVICSRMLLHQDEAKIDAVDHVVIVGGPRDARLVDGFNTFYPDADVQRLHEVLNAESVGMAAEVEADLTPNTGPAMLAALRQIAANKGTPATTNLFAPSLTTRRRRRSLAVAWHTVAMLLVLMGVSGFFGWRYMEGQQDIAERQRLLEMSPVEMPALSPEALKARVDSLNAVHARYNRALHVLDSLLIGSDEWSRTIERTATQTGSVEGIWFDNWSIDPQTIEIKGHAMDRNELATLARSLDGVVEELKFADMEGARVYPFAIRINREIEIPEVATKLRETALDPTTGETADATASDASKSSDADA